MKIIIQIPNLGLQFLPLFRLCTFPFINVVGRGFKAYKANCFAVAGARHRFVVVIVCVFVRLYLFS